MRKTPVQRREKEKKTETLKSLQLMDSILIETNDAAALLNAGI